MSNPRILLVDDNVADVSLLRMAFDEQGQDYELQVLRTGEDALRFVNEHGKNGDDSNPCVILLDLNLPRHDGLVVLQAIRNSPELAHINVVMLSGFASPAQREKVSRLGAAYMQKPMDLEDYFALGTKVIEICKQATELAA
jgi:CheY-like chemotaxis protein